MKHQPKLNEKCMPSLHCMSSFEVTSCNNLKDTTTKFYIFLFNGLTQGDRLVICINPIHDGRGGGGKKALLPVFPL